MLSISSPAFEQRPPSPKPTTCVSSQEESYGRKSHSSSVKKEGEVIRQTGYSTRLPTGEHSTQPERERDMWSCLQQHSHGFCLG
ncbi:unnamed protein product [Pleuronectes platessa]|uniref:Uncharacterized protein n=1 Tax=Pleuronectes platessa TaxID=8262 RepID=A0A9N7V438_PLEPL|nr:unnamed protein product [Pleuronectes platessa]